MTAFIGRREFISLLGGAAAAWPLPAWAQQSERMPRIGVLVAPLESDREAQRWISALREGLEKLGWNDGRNVRIDVRWGPEMPNACAPLRWSWLARNRMSSSPAAGPPWSG